MTIIASIGLVSVACGLACLAEMARSYQQEHRIAEYMSRRGWLTFRDLADLDLGPVETEAWLQHFEHSGRVVRSRSGRYWRWKRG